MSSWSRLAALKEVRVVPHAVLGPPDPDAPIDLPHGLQVTLTGGTFLTTYWPTVIVLAVAAALIGWWLWRRRRSRRPRLRATAYVSVAVVLVLVAALLGVNTWVGYVPTWNAAVRLTGRVLGLVPQEAVEQPLPSDAPSVAAGEHTVGRRTTEHTGGLLTVEIPSTAAGVPASPSWIYLPPDYDAPRSQTRYPVVYMIHGAPGTGADWFSGGNLENTANVLIDSGYLPPCIIVSPDLTAGLLSDRESMNYPGGGPQIEDYFHDDIVPWVDANFRTIADREHRVIGGMSAGAIEALDYALHRPDTYGAVIAPMAYVKPYTAQIVNDPKALERYSVLPLIERLPPGTRLPVYLAQGDMNMQNENREIKRALEADGQPVTLQIFAGLPHNWTMARTSAPYGLIWAAKQLEWPMPATGG